MVKLTWGYLLLIPSSVIASTDDGIDEDNGPLGSGTPFTGFKYDAREPFSTWSD